MQTKHPPIFFATWKEDLAEVQRLIAEGADTSERIHYEPVSRILRPFMFQPETSTPLAIAVEADWKLKHFEDYSIRRLIVEALAETQRGKKASASTSFNEPNRIPWGMKFICRSSF